MVLRASLEKKEEKEKVRAALMRASLHLAAAHGFASLGLREVAREAGIAPTSFYRHFSDMEELGSALIRELAGRMLRELGDRALAASKGSAVSHLVESMVSAVARDPELVHFVVAERAGASASMRALLRGEVGALTRALHTAINGEVWPLSSPPPLAAEAAIVLLLDAAGTFRDEPEVRRPKLQESLIWSMNALLAAAPPRIGPGAP